MHSIPRQHLLLAAILGLASSLHAQIAKPPVAPVRTVTDEYFGQKIDDPYRYLEDQKDPQVAVWMKAQADYTRAVLDSIPGRQKLAAEIEKYLNAEDFTITDVQIAGKSLFYRKRRKDENLGALYIRPLSGGEERLLLDPNKLGTADQHVSLDQYTPSWDGKYVFAGLSAGGAEYAAETGYLIETATATRLPEKFERSFGATGVFSQDSKTLYYVQEQQLAPDVPPTEKYMKLRQFAHTIGSDVSKDVPVFGYDTVPEIHIPPDEAGYVGTTPGSPYVLGLVRRFVGAQLEVYISRADALERKSGWKKVASYSDNITDAAVHSNDIYLVTLKDAPNGKVLQLNASDPDLAKAEVVVPESKAVITGDYVGQDALRPAADALYIQEAEAGIGKVVRLPYGASAKAEEIPAAIQGGSVDSVVADPGQAGALLDVAAWTSPGDYFQYDPEKKKASAIGLVPPNPVDPTNIVAEERQAKAADGTLVPLSIIYKKDTKLDGSSPTALIGYGAYGDVWKPSFNRRSMAWIERGGIVAVAHVRGGGEYGESWHLAGQKLNKPNTWKDFIACAEFLIHNKYTSTAKLGIWSQSAGGILIGRAITEKPDLFAAAVDGVPWSDSLRYENEPNGPPNIPEFGSVKTEEGFKGLFEMSSYAHVKDGTKYPAVLVTSGANDPRVAPWQGAKMYARLAAASTSGKPVLLRVNYDAGHGLTDTVRQQVSDWADIFSFFLWNFGDPDFQSKALASATTSNDKK